MSQLNDSTPGDLAINSPAARAADKQKAEDELKRLRDELAEKDASFRQRFAVEGQPSQTAVERLAASHNYRPAGERNLQAEQDELQAAALFGRGSDAGRANRLALENPGEYKRLRKVAARIGRL